MATRTRLAVFRGDKVLWIIVAALAMMSLLVVYSSTASMAYKEMRGDTSYYLSRQFLFVVVGFFLMIVVHLINYRFYSRIAKPAFTLSVVLVVMSYFMGQDVNNSLRSIPILGFTFQPFELLKVTIVMLMAQQLGARQGVIAKIPVLPSFSSHDWHQNAQKNFDILRLTTKPIIMPIALACCVSLPLGLTTSVVLFLTCVVMLAIGRVRQREITRLLVGAATVGVAMIIILKVAGYDRVNTWQGRIERYLPFVEQSVDGPTILSEDEIQRENADIAVSVGGVFGKGPGNSTQRSNLPLAFSDFAYAIILEEYGALGGLLIFALYTWVFFRAGMIVNRCKKAFPCLLVAGLSMMITLQAFINMMVSVGVFPITGQNLPLISHGGTSIIFTSIAFGMILGVSRQVDQEEAEEAKEKSVETT